MPPQFANVVAVDNLPSGTHAVVFIAYNEPPDIEPYVVLCEREADGWASTGGGSAGGVSWMSTSEDGSAGVETTWEPPAVRWNVPGGYWREVDPDGIW